MSDGPGGTDATTGDDAAPGRTSAARSLARRLEGLDDRWVALAVAVLPVVLVLLAVVRAQQLSLYDEPTHLDYAWRVAHGEVPASGDVLDRETLLTWSCRGQMPPVPPESVPPCGTDDPAAFAAAGLQYNAFHPPLYYAVTGLVARAASGLLGVDFVDAARALGALYVGAAVAAFHLLLRRWGLSAATCVLGALALGLTPSFLQLGATVTNDAVTPLAGVAALLVLTRVVREGRHGWVVPAVLTAVVAATKVVNAVGLLAVAVVLGVHALVLARRSGWRAGLPSARVAAAIGGALALVHLGWSAYQDGRTAADYVNPVAGVNGKPVQGLPFGEWAPTLVSGFGVAGPRAAPPETVSTYVLAYAAVMVLLVGCAWLLVLVTFDRGEPELAVGATLLAGCLLYPLLVQLQVYLSGGQYFPNVSSRYGLSLVPTGLACLALVVQRRRLGLAAAAVVAVGALVLTSAYAGLRVG